MTYDGEGRFLRLSGFISSFIQPNDHCASRGCRNDSPAVIVKVPTHGGSFRHRPPPAGQDDPTFFTARGLAMTLWTFTMQASMCCMFSWMRACHQGVALAHSFAGMPGLPILSPPRPPADVLPFPARRAARGGGFGGALAGPAEVIPLGRR